MHSISCEISGWMKNKPESRLLDSGRNINNLKNAGSITFMAESEEELKCFLMKMIEESKKADLKLNIQKTKIMASSPITSWQIEGEQWKQ